MKTQIVYSVTCPTCTRAHTAPFRVVVDGRIVNGCVDEFHTDHLPPISASNTWHHRPEARKIRAANKAARGGSVTHFGRVESDGMFRTYFMDARA